MIGSWNNSNCVCGIFPQCWKNGNGHNDILTLDTDNVSLPIYIGPSDTGITGFECLQYGGYYSSDGKIYPTDRSTLDTNQSYYKITGLDPTGWVYTGSYSIEVWWDLAKSDVIAPAYSLGYIYLGGNSSDYILFRAFERNTNNLYFHVTVRAGGANYYIYGNAAEVAEEGLHHWVWTSAAGTMSVYVDGQQITDIWQYKAWTAGTISPGETNCYLYCDWNTNYTTPNAKINSLIFYDTDIGSSRISANYALGVDYGGLIGYSYNNILYLNARKTQLQVTGVGGPRRQFSPDLVEITGAIDLPLLTAAGEAISGRVINGAIDLPLLTAAGEAEGGEIIPILTQVERKIKCLIDGIRIADGYMFDWGISNEDDHALKNGYPNAEIYLQSENNQDEIGAVWAGAYTNIAIFEVHVYNKLTENTTNPNFSINEYHNKTLYDLKKLFGTYYNLEGICISIMYRSMRRETSQAGDMFVPGKMITEWSVSYYQNRTAPSLVAGC